MQQPVRPGRLRIAYLLYRGNPRCGGQGVYTRHLTRELAAPARVAITFEPELGSYVRPACRVERWTVPAVSDGYDAARDAIRARVDRLIEGLVE